MSSKPSNRVLALGDELRFETAGAVARYGNLDLAVLGQDRLAAGAIAAVARPSTARIALLIAEMFAQLGGERALDQRLLQLLEQPVVSGQALGLLIVSKQLIKQFRCYRRHVSLLGRVNSQKPAYTFLMNTLLRCRRLRRILVGTFQLEDISRRGLNLFRLPRREAWSSLPV
ncbi:hypothetical protein ACVIGA_005918 [Bradyrhizobium sp. USDA 3240]